MSAIPIVTLSVAVVLPPTVRHTQYGVILPSWPLETDLHIIPGTTRIALTGQQPTVRMVIGEAIENVRVSLLFVDAFPDAARTHEFIRDGLLTVSVKTVQVFGGFALIRLYLRM